jgi:hypothetical protein
MSQFSSNLIVLTALFGAVACGGAAVPSSDLTAAKVAVRAAEVGGADGQPQPALQLKHARDQINSAEALIKEEENEKALWLLKRAQVDAELALAMAQEAVTVAQAKDALEQVERMKKQIKDQ